MECDYTAEIRAPAVGGLHDEWTTGMRIDDGRRVELEEGDGWRLLIFTVVNTDLRFFGQGVTENGVMYITKAPGLFL